MPHVLVAGPIHASGITVLEAAEGISFEVLGEVSEASCAARIAGAEAVILRTQPLSAATVALAPRLRIVSRHGVGHDAVDLAALSERGIALAITAEANAASVAEHAMALLLACAKRLPRAEESARGDWAWRHRLEPIELGGRRLLVLGCGRAGQRLARLAAAFGMEVRAYDPPLAARGWPQGAPAPAGDLLPALGWADAVSLHVPKGDRPLLGPVELAAMRNGALLVNTARGGVVDEAALLAALDDGRIAAAGLDVFEEEPPPAGHPLLAHPRVVATPHIAGLTAEAAERMAVMAARNVVDFLAGRLDPSLLVNPEAVR